MSRTRKNGALVTTAGHLTSALQLVMLAMHRRSAIPLLSCVLIDGDTLEATDLDVYVTAKLPAGQANLRACLDAAQLHSIVSNLRGETEIKVARNEDVVRLTFEGGIYELVSLNPDDWSRCDLEFDWSECSNWNLRQPLSRVAFAISREETRYYLNGVCFSADKEGTPCLVATDGHRLAAATIEGCPWSDGQIAPRKFVEIALKLPAIERIGFSETHVAIEASGVRVVSRLIDGTFPDWQRVMPQPSSRIAYLPCESLVPTSKRLLRAAGKKRNPGVVFSLTENGVTVSTSGSLHEGGGAERLPDATFSGAKPTEVGLNVRYVQDMAEAVSLDGLTLEVGEDGTSPVAHREPGLELVLMPIRTDSPHKLVSLLNRETAR